MNIDTVKENMCMNTIVGRKKQTVVVEGDTIITDIKPDILNTISTNGMVCIYKKEVLDSKVRIDGNVEIYLIYLADGTENNIRGLNTSIDFTEILDFENCKSSMSMSEQVKVKSIECKVLNGRKINLKAILEIEITIYSNENIEMITNVNNIEDIQSLSNNINMNSLVGENTCKTSVNENMIVDNTDTLAEILNVEINIINKDSKASYNKVLAKADAQVRVMYLTENDEIKVVEELFPIMGFIDMTDVSEEDINDLNYKIKNTNIRLDSSDVHTINVDIEFEIACRTYKNQEMKLMQDLYSPTQNLCIEQRNIKTLANMKKQCDVFNVREKIQNENIIGNQVFDAIVRPEINETNILKDKIMYDGELNICFLLTGDNSVGINTINTKIPFNVTVNMQDVDNNSIIDTQIDVKNQSFVVNNSTIDANIDLEVTTNMCNTEEVNIIENITSEETECVPACSMVIYFVKPGDTLWKIAKQYKSTVEDIVRINQIQNPDKIDVGMQLFIPKYCCKRQMSA